MAKFSDQFEKRDPLTFNAFGIFDLWPRQIAWEARDLLEGRTTVRLTEVANAIEAVVLAELSLLLSKPDEEGDPRFRANPKALEYGTFLSPKDPEDLRLQHSDVNLFIAATSGSKAEKLNFEQWEGLAVLALWKLIDFFETITAPRRELGDGFPAPRPTTEKKFAAMKSSTPDLVEAMRACTLAGEAKMRTQQLSALGSAAQRQVSEALYEAETKRRNEVSKKCRDAVLVRHSKTEDHKAQALAYALSKPFKNLTHAARFAADNVEKSPNVFYTPGAVGEWLKAAKWRSMEGPTK